MLSWWALRKLGYKVLGNIGEGGYGQVKLATSKKHPNKVAIKIMNCRSKSPRFATKFLPRELAILRCVKHPHIVEVYDIYEIPNKKVFIVMEAAAMDLSQKIKELGHMPADQARTVFSQLVSAVSYLHQQDIAHRDLKCANVLLTADGQVKLTDFGFGCFTPGFPDLRKTFHGTLYYVPPEVLMHEPYDGKKNDVWSMGIILYFMVTGRLPFKKKPKGVSLLRLQRNGVRFPPAIPVEEPCRELIAYMLCFNPKIRPSITEVQQDPWLQLMPEEETSGTADLSGLEAESPLDQNVLENAGEHSEGKSEDQEQQQHSVEDDLQAKDLEQCNLPKSSGLLSSTMKALEQDDVQTSEKSSPVIDRPAKTADEDEDGQRSSASSPDVSALQAVEEAPQSSSSFRNVVEALTAKSFRCESEMEAVSSNTGASRSKKSVEVVGVEESGCLSCSPLCTAQKRAAKKYVAAPIVRTAQTLRRKTAKWVKKILKKTGTGSTH